MTTPEAKPSPITGIKRVPVASSNIAEIGHHEFSGVIEVKFRNGSVWQYPGPFDKYTFEAFRDAESVGKFFRAHIYSRNHAQRHINVTQDEDAAVAAAKESGR